MCMGKQEGKDEEQLKLELQQHTRITHKQSMHNFYGTRTGIAMATVTSTGTGTDNGTGTKSDGENVAAASAALRVEPLNLAQCKIIWLADLANSHPPRCSLTRSIPFWLLGNSLVLC